MIDSILQMNIKARIKEQGWTSERLSKEMTNRDGSKGISQPSMSSIVNGNPTIDKLREIAAIIGISLSELVADEPESCVCPEIVCPKCGEHIRVSLKVE